MVAAGVHELPLVGGHTGLDLVNTVEPRLAVPDRHEHLDDPEALLAWAQRAELVTDAEAGRVAAAWSGSAAPAAHALDMTIDIRESLHRALLGVLDPGTDARDQADALQRLTERWASAAGRSRLVRADQGRDQGRADQGRADQGRAAVRMDVGIEATLLIPDRAAVSAVDLLCSVDLAHLRACPHQDGGCGWMFLDHSRNGSRRWCSMADCGARAKARRLTERRRARRA